jgi:threonine dehydratase
VIEPRLTVSEITSNERKEEFEVLKKYGPIPIDEIKAARERISEDIIRTPLVRLNVDDAPAEIYLKLENLQPIRSFKIRGASNAMRLLDKELLKDGVWTASAGNWAQGLAWTAKKSGIRCTIILPTHVPEAKLDKIIQLGAEVIKVPADKFFDIFVTKTYEGMEGTFVHAFSDPAVMAGSGTIGIEILEDLPDVDTILTPWGGGGLTCGVASAIRETKPDTKIYACEIETCTPLTTSYRSGKAATNISYTHSFVDGIGGPMILPEMWQLAQTLIEGTTVVSLKETVEAIRTLAEWNCVIAEGAGAVPVAAALSGKAGSGKVACVVSGGNIDQDKLVKIFQGQVP